MRVAYQGVPAAYSHLAVIQLCPSDQHIPCDTFEDAFQAVVSGTADRALLPIHNSLGGAVHANYDLLIRYQLRIVGETHLRVRHALLALPGTKIEQVGVVMSHPQALAQCDEYIRRLELTRSPQNNTAGSAKMIAEQRLKNTAAIASVKAAEIYGLEILDEGIEDEPGNYTRFLLLSKEDNFVPELGNCGNCLTSVAFTLQSNVPGALFKALSVFALRDIDLTKIESRPAKGLEVALDEKNDMPQVFQYLFYVDFIGHVHDVKVTNAMRHLSEIAPLVRVLGCYERDNFFSFSAQVAKTNGARKVVVKQSTPAVSLNILIVGFGNFGQFLSKELVRQGHNVSAWNVTDESLNAQKLSVVFESDLNNFAKFERRFDVVIFSVSIMAFANVVASFPFHFECFASSLIVDVLSVKMYAKQILSLHVPKSADILLTHPMFGRESGKRSWINLPMVFEKLRITDIHRCSCFLSIFSSKGCEMLEMQSETHDAYSAGSQFITHLTGRILSRLGPSSTPINTKGFEVLLQLVENTCKDSWELFYGIFKHNPRSLEQLGAFEEAFLDVKQILLSDLQSNSSDTSEIEFSPRITAIQQSGTAAIFDLAESLRRQGKPIISLSVGEPDFPVPKPIKEAIVDALMKDQTKYTPIAGVFELRKSIAEKLKKENGLDYAPEQIVVSNGAKQSIVQAAMALVRPGDQVLIPTPYWTSYRDMVTLSGGKTIEIPCSYEAGYKLSAENLRKNLMNAKRARLLMLNYPSNPTGVIYSKEELFALARVLEEFPDVFIISDEIYEHIMYEGEHVSFASLPRMHERTITVNGFSKAFCMTGLRIGYAAASKQIVSQLVKIQSHLTSSACSISQYGAIAALKLEKSVISGMVEKFKQRRDVIVSRFQKIKGMRILVPHGAFYIYADISVLLNENTKGLKSDSEFCMELLEKYNIAAVPGAAFGLSGCFRISYATSDENISKALDGIEKFVQDLYS